MTMALAAPALVAHPAAAAVDVLPVRDCVRAARRAGERSRW